jgi:MEMO1 family protein
MGTRPPGVPWCDRDLEKGRSCVSDGEVLPPLRRNLEFMPSPVADRPGLLIRDPYRYSDAIVIIPPPLVPWLAYFDGERSRYDLRADLVRASGGDLRAGEVVDHLAETLSREGFLDDTRFAGIKTDKERSFAAAPSRSAVHAGSAYPIDPKALAETVGGYLNGAPAGAPSPGLATVEGGVPLGIAAPHVSPEGGWRAYRAAYEGLAPELRDRTFVILGTSHYGAPDRFGLTGKSFGTPFGEARVDREILEELAAAAPEAVEMEDYCHSVEHSIEFQVVFLQHLFGPALKFVPILCGPFARSLYEGGRPEDDPAVGRFFDALAAVHAARRDRLFYVLGVDMAHVGRRYGDRFSARAHEGRLREVEDHDRRRIGHLCQGDASSFWSELQEDGDRLRWCGSSPLYTFLRSVSCRGELRRYEQWNIDERSVVSFAGLVFRSPIEGSIR